MWYDGHAAVATAVPHSRAHLRFSCSYTFGLQCLPRNETRPLAFAPPKSTYNESDTNSSITRVYEKNGPAFVLGYDVFAVQAEVDACASLGYGVAMVLGNNYSSSRSRWLYLPRLSPVWISRERCDDMIS